MKIKVTQKSPIWKLNKIQENQPEISFAKVVQSLNIKPETKETSAQYNEKDSVIKPNSKVITTTLKLNLNRDCGTLWTFLLPFFTHSYILKMNKLHSAFLVMNLLQSNIFLLLVQNLIIFAQNILI